MFVFPLLQQDMDARNIARIANVKLGTLNAWAHRDLIPGLPVGTRGKKRDIAFDTALRILILTELIHIGLDSEKAAGYATNVDTALEWAQVYLSESVQLSINISKLVARLS